MVNLLCFQFFSPPVYLSPTLTCFLPPSVLVVLVLVEQVSCHKAICCFLTLFCLNSQHCQMWLTKPSSLKNCLPLGSQKLPTFLGTFFSAFIFVTYTLVPIMKCVSSFRLPHVFQISTNEYMLVPHLHPDFSELGCSCLYLSNIGKSSSLYPEAIPEH